MSRSSHPSGCGILKNIIRTSEKALHTPEKSFYGARTLRFVGGGIDRIVKEEGLYEPDEITILSNYGAGWPSNPGYNLYFLDRYEGEICFDDKTYFIFNKFKLYRADVPDFIHEVDPVYTVNFKGEIGTWVYRADQLSDYKEWFEQYGSK